MENENEIFIENSVLLKNIQKYLSFHGDFEAFQNFLLNNDTELSSDISQFVILYNNDKKIISAQHFDLVSKSKEEEEDASGCNLFKDLFFFPLVLWKKYKINKKGVAKKFEILKQEDFSNLVNVDHEIKFILLEIPTKKIYSIRELQETLEWFLKNDFFKYRIDMEKNLGFFSIPKLLVVAYLSLIVSTVIRALDILPFNLISESEIILTVKVLLSILLSTGSFLFIITALAIYVMHKYQIFYSKYNFFFYASRVIKIYLIGFSLYSIFSSLHFNVNKSFESFFFPIHKWAANFYINNKTMIVFDKSMNKTIIYLGSRDRMYYFYDSFDVNMSKIDANNTENIKEIILGTHETNSTESLVKGHWKMKYINDLTFDYNETLIINDLNKTIH